MAPAVEGLLDLSHDLQPHLGAAAPSAAVERFFSRSPKKDAIAAA
jgi:hypothetical protein